MTGKIICSDALEALRQLPTHSVDSIVTDPPAGIAFMSKDWDKDKGGRDQWVSWLAEILAEARRVLKPGGHALVWALPRTSHWTAYALENAGFEIRDCVYHLFGEGMPKSHNISKAIDRIAGAEREIIELKKNNVPHYRNSAKGSRGKTNDGRNAENWDSYTQRENYSVTAPATPEAQLWDSWGTGLKPAVEEWILARSPLAEPTIAANVLEYGTGAINIDDCRISTDENIGRINEIGANGWKNSSGGPSRATYDPVAASGRWPANLLLSHSLLCTPEGCDPDCPIALIDQQSGFTTSNYRINKCSGIGSFSNSAVPTKSHNDSGGASRYFQQFYYTPKAKNKEKNAGCKALPDQPGFSKNTSHQIAHINHATGETSYSDYQPSQHKNNHPTVKSISLMRYLTRMITPPGGICLDMFAGSGTTGIAAIQEGFGYILIEQSAEYVQIIEARIAYALAEREAA